MAYKILPFLEKITFEVDYFYLPPAAKGDDPLWNPAILFAGFFAFGRLGVLFVRLVLSLRRKLSFRPVPLGD